MKFRDGSILNLQFITQTHMMTGKRALNIYSMLLLHRYSLLCLHLLPISQDSPRNSNKMFYWSSLWRENWNHADFQPMFACRRVFLVETFVYLCVVKRKQILAREKHRTNKLHTVTMFFSRVPQTFYWFEQTECFILVS